MEMSTKLKPNRAQEPIRSRWDPRLKHNANRVAWDYFIRANHRRGDDLRKMRRDFEGMNKLHPVPKLLIADLFLKPADEEHAIGAGPMAPFHLEILAHTKIVDANAFLKAMYRYSTSRDIWVNNRPATPTADASMEVDEKKSKYQKVVRWRCSYSLEEPMFYALAKLTPTVEDALETMVMVVKWMALFTAVDGVFIGRNPDELLIDVYRDRRERTRTALVMYIITLGDNDIILRSLKRPCARGIRKALGEALVAFIPSVEAHSLEMAARLRQFQGRTLPLMDHAGKAGLAEMEDMLSVTLGLETYIIPVMPHVNSRAALYVYLNAALIGRPMVDDTAVFNYINNRYQGRFGPAATDLILASFDVLANAINKNKDDKSATLLRSFLVNKVPVILTSFVAANYMTDPYKLNMQWFVGSAMTVVATNTFPTISSLFDTSNNSNPLTESVRQDFCYACCLHDLIPEAAVEQLLGGLTYQSLPAGGRYDKARLVQQCIIDPDRTQALVGELENMDGNVGAVTQALVEMMSRLCANKEVMTLKLLCTQLIRKPLALDVILLFDDVSSILLPLCTLLDNWTYDEDQGEYQPVYEEFGNILLLVLVLVNRYDVSVEEIGLGKPDSFTAKLLGTGQLSRYRDEMTEQESTDLDGWLGGLFNSESGGLSDELMSSCPPQQFYLLVPALYQTILQAFASGQLNGDALRNGLEFFHEVFLLPALVIAITHLSKCLPVSRPDESGAALKILHLVLQPKQISNDAGQMLASVITTVASPLTDALRLYQKRNPTNLEVEPLLQTLKDSVPLSKRTATASVHETESWTGPNQEGLEIVIKHTVQGLIQWSLNPAGHVMPASYTHRQILKGVNSLGAKAILQVILEELKEQTKQGHASMAFDVAAAIVGAPEVSSELLPQQPLVDVASLAANMAKQEREPVNLREALRKMAIDCKKIEKQDAQMAQIVVRLHRKVEAALLITMPAPYLQSAQPVVVDVGALNVDEAVTAAAIDDVMAAVGVGGDVGADAVGMAGDPLAMDTSGLGLDLGGGGMGDMGLGAMSAAGSVVGMDLGGAADDIFGDLGTLDGWDDMNLG